MQALQLEKDLGCCLSSSRKAFLAALGNLSLISIKGCGESRHRRRHWIQGYSLVVMLMVQMPGSFDWNRKKKKYKKHRYEFIVECKELAIKYPLICPFLTKAGWSPATVNQHRSPCISGHLWLLHPHFDVFFNILFPSTSSCFCALQCC